MKLNAAILGSLVLVTNCWHPAATSAAVRTAAIVARQTIDFVGTNAVTVDSYDSSDPAKSTNGHYDSSKYAGDMGDIAANGAYVNTSSLNVGNATIYGHAHVGAGGSMSIGPNGAVGEHSWQATNSGVEAGWFAADANFTFPDTTFPYSSNSADVLTSTTSGDVVAVIYTYTTNVVSSSTLPSPIPWGGVITNSSYFTVTPWSAVPSPTPTGIITNGPFITNSPIWAPGAYVTNTAVNTSITYPTPGTYLGSVTTNWNGAHTQITSYTYNHITSYFFHYYKYTYPVITYLYTLYTTNAIFQTNHYDNILVSGTSYYLNSLTGSTYVAGMDVKLVVANGIDLSQPITIPQGSAIEVWSGGTWIGLTGNQVINQSGQTKAFVIYCAPSVTDLDFYGTTQFTGVIFAPNADVVYNSGSQNHLDFCGALFVNSARIIGSASFHFDEALNYVSPYAPQITNQPASQIVLAGQTATFNVSVTCAAPVTYQWWFDNAVFQYGPAAIVDATNSTLVVTNVGMSNVCSCPGGDYWVVVSNAFGTAISSAAQLLVLFPPVISSQPLSQAVAPGSNATLVVGCPFITPPVVRQWRFNGSPLPGGTNSTLKITAMTLADVGDYDVIITNPYGSTTSEIAHVSIELTPQLGSSLWTSDGQFQFGVSGVPGYEYAVQASTNLTDWISLITNTSPFTFSDPDAIYFPQRYYRSAYIPQPAFLPGKK